MAQVHVLPLGVPAPSARILVMVSRSMPHAAVYGAGRWAGIAERYSVPAKSMGYTGCVIRFPATKIGNARPDDAMSFPEIGEYTSASRLGCPFLSYMMPPPSVDSASWIKKYFPPSQITFIDQSVGMNLSNHALWDSICSSIPGRVGVEPKPDINITEQHTFPSIIWWSLLKQGNPYWLPVAKRKAEMLVVMDIPFPKPDDLILKSRQLWDMGYSPVLMADHVIEWGIRASDLRP